MKIEVSIGECFDKYSILELKSQRITNAEKRKDVLAELDALSSVTPIIDKHSFLYSLLIDSNRKIWDLTDMLKQIHEPNESYAKIAYQVINENQTRFRIKSMINHFADSTIKEQKSYAESEISIRVTDIKKAIAVLWKQALLYDKVVITGDHVNILTEIFRTPNFSFTTRETAINDTDLYDSAIETKYPPPIRYASGGRLGDFVHQLSVVFEKFIETGRRGIIYMGERNINADIFARGLDYTFHDIKPIVESLPYVHSIEMYAGQPYDINLSVWRNVPNLYSKSWQDIYGETYGVRWGVHQWLTSGVRDDLKHITLLCSSPSRWPDKINWNALVQQLPGTVMFLRVSDGDYSHFCQQTGLNIPYVDVASFSDIVVAIHSCLMFVGTLSMPLAVADGLKKKRLALVQSGHPDTTIATLTNPNYVSS